MNSRDLLFLELAVVKTLVVAFGTGFGRLKACFYERPHGRKTEKSIGTGVSWKTAVAGAIGWCNGKCCIWVKLAMHSIVRG